MLRVVRLRRVTRREHRSYRRRLLRSDINHFSVVDTISSVSNVVGVDVDASELLVVVRESS